MGKYVFFLANLLIGYRLELYVSISYGLQTYMNILNWETVIIEGFSKNVQLNTVYI